MLENRWKIHILALILILALLTSAASAEILEITSGQKEPLAPIAEQEEFSEKTEPAEKMDQTEQTVPILDLPALESGTLVEIPVGQNSMKVSIEPKEECYIYEEGAEDPTGYADPSITVNIGHGRFLETNYIYARVKIAAASQLRTLLASSINSSHTTPGHDLARRVKAVIAINGDYCGGEDNRFGVIMRQGQMLRLKSSGSTDLLMIDKAGNFHILKKGSDEDVKAVEDQAVNIFTFGPALIMDGEPQAIERNNHYGSHIKAQRMAICQTGPLEYLLITSEGPQNPGSRGLTVEQFTELISTNMPEVRTAYNLDGGSSSTMVFHRNGKKWLKINALSNPKVRPLKDIIYFATAWE